jgi:DNA-binding SARP family transcriptional activator
VLIRLTGLTAIEHEHARVQHLSSSQAQIAFARLVLERAVGTSRDQLADTIWPGGLPDTWASALRSVVSRVRSFLRYAGFPETILIAQGGRYLLELPQDVQVDLDIADRCLERAIAALNGTDFANALQLASSAATCLQNEFMPEHEGEWIDSVRKNLNELLLSALETASLAAAALNDERAALRYADEAVRRAPMRESSYRCRMNAHAMAGNRAEAMRTYHNLRRVLAEEMGIDPAPETQAAYVDLLGGPEPGPGRARRSQRAGFRAEAAFTGRVRELAKITEAWSQTELGVSHIALISGEPGVGKTRLAMEAARRVTLNSGLVMYGRCHPGAAPFQPVAEALSGYLASLPEDAAIPLASAARAALSAVLADSPEPEEESAAPSRAEMLHALAGALTAVARDRPVFLVLDDLDLADESTLLLLRHIFRHRSGTSLLVVATAGKQSGGPRQLSAALDSIEQDPLTTRIQLPGLDEHDVRALVHQLSPEAGGTGAVTPHRLISETAGNAYLLLELLHHYREPERAAGLLPGSIREYAQARHDALEPAARQLLCLASVAGRSFELDIVARAAGFDIEAATDTIDLLLASKLIVEAPEAARKHSYRFRQDVLRQAIAEQLSAVRRRQLHERLADSIERQRASDLGRYSTELAHHRATAAGPDGDQRAVRWVWRAAATAAQQQIPNEAVRLYRLALDHVPAEDLVLKAEALTNLGRAQHAAGHPGCEQTLFDGAIQGLHCGRLDIAAQAALGLADATTSHAGLRSEAIALIELLVEAAGADLRQPTAFDEVTLGRLLARQARLGQPLSVGGTTTAALHALARELSLLEGPDFLERRSRLADEMLSVALAVQDSQAIIVAAHHRAMSADMSGDLAARKTALASLANAVASNGEEIDSRGDALLLDHAVATAVTQGRFTDAVTMTRIATAAAMRDPGARSPYPISPAPGSLAARQIHVAGWLHRSRWPMANVGFSSSYGTAEQALTALISGDRGWPHLRVRALVTGSDPLPAGDEWPHVAGLLALGAVEIGDATTADAVRALLTPYANLTCGIGYRTYAGPVTFHLGRLAIVAGDWAEAERHLVAALSQLMSRQARPWMALAQLALAQALQARGRPGDQRSADALRAEAARTLSNLSLRPANGQA